MTNISVAEAKNRLSELIARVEGGAEITVTRRGKPVARLVAVVAPDHQTRRTRVAEALRQLEVLRGPIRLDGDLKAIARDGLD